MSRPEVNGLVRAVRGAEEPRVEGEEGRKKNSSPSRRDSLLFPFHISTLQASAHFGGGGAGPGKVPLALCPGTGAPPASVPSFYSSCFWLSLFCFSFCISFSRCVYLIPFSASLFSPYIGSPSLPLFIFCCICLHLSAVVASPHDCPASTLSLSPSTVSPALSLSLLAGRMGEEAQGRCGPGSLPAAAGPPRICGFRLLYLGLQLPLIFWLQDTRPGLGQPGPRTQGGRARLAGGEGQGAGRCVLWGACEP